MLDTNLKENSTQYPTEELVATFSRLVDESNGDVSVMLEKLEIPADLQESELEELKENLKLLKSGDKQDIERFVDKVKIASQELDEPSFVAAAANQKGGVTKFRAYWWGPRLYISHDLLSTSGDAASLVSAVTGVLSTAGAIASAGVTVLLSGVALIGFQALKLLDKGNGVMLSKYGWIGPIIPASQ